MIQEEFMRLARAAALGAERTLWSYFGALPEELKATKKPDGTLCTLADLESEQAIRSALAPLSSDCSFYGEELSKEEMCDARYSILIDPLDGTSNYYRGRSDFGICIALVDNLENSGQVISVIVYEPSTRRLWTAHKGHGAFVEHIGQCPPKPVRVSQRLPKEGDLCYDASTSARRPIRTVEHKITAISEGIRFYKRFRMLGSNVLAHALVANGSFEAAVTDTVGGPFDLAGYLLVEEAGGMATNLELKKINVWKDLVVITSNGKAHEQFVHALKSHYE
jgi:myo-inositol-1(or 4)-monophosphatase